MPENLRITTAVPTSDSMIKPNASPQSPQVDAVDPSRVTQPNTKDQKTGSQSLDLLLSRESVFGKFIQQLRQTPALSQTLEKLLFDLSGRQDILARVLQEDSPLRQLAQNLPAGKGDMLEALKFQQKDSSLFSGGLFRLLGQISQQSGDDTFDLLLAGFLKAFDGYRTVPDTMQSILANLETIERQIAGPYAKQLHDAVQDLPYAKLTQDQEGQTSDDSFQKLGAEPESAEKGADPEAFSASGNLQALKKNVLPLLSEYISKSSDYGKVRENVSLLLNNTAILQVSTRENMEEQLGKLITYARHSLNLTSDALQQLQILSSRELSGDPQKLPENKFFSALLSLLPQGVKEGAAGFEKTVYQDIVHSLLLDNSVYMPFVHFYLPMNMQGRNLFAQMWVEKDNTDEHHSAASEKKPRSLFLTFDIQGLGYFEAFVTLQNRKADIRLNCPPSLVKKSGDIVPDVSQILRSNGFTAGEIRVASSDKPEIPGLILQKINERKRSIDVTV